MDATVVDAYATGRAATIVSYNAGASSDRARLTSPAYAVQARRCLAVNQAWPSQRKGSQDDEAENLLHRSLHSIYHGRTVTTDRVTCQVSLRDSLGTARAFLSCMPLSRSSSRAVTNWTMPLRAADRMLN